MIKLPQETRSAPCNQCLRDTNHWVKWEEHAPWEQILDEELGHSIDGANTYTLLECAGCNQVRLLHTHWMSEDSDDCGHACIHREYYPPTITRRRPLWRRTLLPFHMVVVDELNPLFDEIYLAHASGAYTLATMGIRAVTEKIMVDQVGDQGTFAKTIETFFARGFIAPVQQKHFRSVLVEAGHAAMHRSFRPKRDDVETLLDLVEGLVEAIYYQPLRAGAVGQKLPPDTRPKRPRRAPSQ